MWYIIGVLVAVSLVWIYKSVKNAPYFDEDTNRFVPKDKEAEYLADYQKRVDNLIKKL